MNEDWLAAALLSYEADEPHSGEDDSSHYPPISTTAYRRDLTREHDGDCVNQPMPCRRCFAEEARFQARWILAMAAEAEGGEWMTPEPCYGCGAAREDYFALLCSQCREKCAAKEAAEQAACAKCDVCQGATHHWLPVAADDHDFECKHCDVTGNYCRACGGVGCDICKGEGVGKARKRGLD